MGKVLQIVCMVTILVTITVNMTNAQGKIISMCMHTSLMRHSFSDDALFCIHGYMCTWFHPILLFLFSFDDQFPIIIFLHPSPNQQKEFALDMMKLWWNMMKLWWNYDETYDETYDVIATNTASKYLAHMKGCWDLEFEPSVEEIVDHRWDMAILSVRFLWRARTGRNFPI